jgi:CRISPR-associated protein Cas2
METRRLYLTAYDVTEPQRLRAALYCARTYATGGQKSVHECWLTDAERADLIATMDQILEPEDAFFIVRLDPRQTVRALGRGVVPQDPDWFYVG